MKKKNKQTFINEELNMTVADDKVVEQYAINFDNYTTEPEEVILEKAIEEENNKLEEKDPRQISFFDENESNLQTEQDEIPNEFKVRDELREMRSKIKTFDELVAFLSKVKNEYNYGYGEAPRAIAQAALATAWYLSSEFGITGFQAGAIMWDFIVDWRFTSNKCGLRIVDFDELLYPQYRYKFEHTNIPVDVWNKVQEEAKRLVADVDMNSNNEHYVMPCESVYKYWKQLAAGKIPHNCKISDD